MTHTTITPTSTTSPILQGHHTIGPDTVPFAVHVNLGATSPAHSFVGFARYQNHTFVAFADNAPDCQLGLGYMLQDAARRPLVKERILLDASIPEPPTLH